MLLTMSQLYTVVFYLTHTFANITGQLYNSYHNKAKLLVKDIMYSNLQGFQNAHVSDFLLKCKP